MTFPEGFAIEWDGQLYRPVRVREHVKLDGTSTSMIDWDTECPSCGKAFVVSTTLIVSKWRRRCDDCKAPGRSVRSDRKLFRKQIAGTEP